MQKVARTDQVQAKQRKGENFDLAAKIHSAVRLVDFASEPDEKSGEEQNELDPGAQQPWERGQAEHPDEKRVGKAALEVIDLTHERDVHEEKRRAQKLKRLAELGVFLVGPAQPPPDTLRPQHQAEADGDFQPPRNVVPMGGHEQRDPCRNQDGTEEEDHTEKFSAVLFELKMRNNGVALFSRD